MGEPNDPLLLKQPKACYKWSLPPKYKIYGNIKMSALRSQNFSWDCRFGGHRRKSGKRLCARQWRYRGNVNPTPWKLRNPWIHQRRTDTSTSRSKGEDGSANREHLAAFHSLLQDFLSQCLLGNSKDLGRLLRDKSSLEEPCITRQSPFAKCCRGLSLSLLHPFLLIFVTKNQIPSEHFSFPVSFSLDAV